MKKVVTPTRKELINMTTVVLVFVVIVMGIVTVLDLGFGQAVLWIFGGNVNLEQ
ncbi:preprotein translocase subunit SecE [Arthrobacter alpinus]|nr:preprotein translocase subunit SecE [Arthrobacter alpinus]